jgi:hypothetical protein
MVNAFFLRWLPLLVIGWFCIIGRYANAQSFGWQQRADYHISVTLDTKEKTLDGSLELMYTNASPDTLTFIWMHLWPNAYKSDKTAFAEQHLLTGQSDFYFSQPGQKGYINQLNFSVDGKAATLEDHPVHLDIVKLVLPSPLLPGQSANIVTPFHVQLPYRFSRMGYVDSFYSITQWFPKAAVYDADGWHPMTYLELGEYYSDFGNYEIEVTLPCNYMVAATGVLQTQTELDWLLAKSKEPVQTYKPIKKTFGPKRPLKDKEDPFMAPKKTVIFKAEKVIDFAWFAYPDWQVKHDEIVLNGHRIDAWNFVLPAFSETWKNSMDFTRQAIEHYSKWLGIYPYPQVTVVCDPQEGGSGMEYPMITGLNTTGKDEETLQQLIVHEVGHNWFQAVLANNEREHPWLDEGLNTFLEKKFFEERKAVPLTSGKKLNYPNDSDAWLLSLVKSLHADQPIETSSQSFTPINYYTIPYTKTAQWLQALEHKIGQPSMQQALKDYYKQHAFTHVQPQDLKDVLKANTNIDLENVWQQLQQSGPVVSSKTNPSVWPGDILLDRKFIKNRKVGLAPALGFNEYDKAQVGLILHNYSLPFKPFQWVATPMYATGSKQITGYARSGYTFFPKNRNLHKVELFTSAAHFNTKLGRDLNNEKVFGGFTKFMPGMYAELKKKNPLSTLTRFMEFKTWIINEKTLATEAPPPPGDTIFYTIYGPNVTTVIPQLTVGWKNNRALYPYSIQAGVQQVKDIVRLTAEAKYFYNYDATGKGIQIRAFAGKIFYLKDKTDAVRIDNSRYHFSTYGPNGVDDYTYSTPFMDRNQSTQFNGRQIMERDGFFKYRSDFSSVRPGLSTEGLDFFDNWMATLNFSFDVPDKINPLSLLPFDVPLKIFADIGTSSSPWRSESEQEKFLYSIGIHLPLLKVMHIYLPLIDSKAFEEPNSVNDPNRPGGALWWQKKLTFAFDLQALKPRILNTPLLH